MPKYISLRYIAIAKHVWDWLTNRFLSVGHAIDALGTLGDDLVRVRFGSKLHPWMRLQYATFRGDAHSSSHTCLQMALSLMTSCTNLRTDKGGIGDFLARAKVREFVQVLPFWLGEYGAQREYKNAR